MSKVTIIGPALDDASITVERSVNESEVPAWRDAGYEKGSLAADQKEKSDAYWKQKASELPASVKEAQKEAKADVKEEAEEPVTTGKGKK